MVDKKIRLKEQNEDGTYDYLFPATKSSIVDVNGKTLDDALAETDVKITENNEKFTAQLAQTEQEVKRKRELEDLSPTVLSAIEGGEGTTFELLSIPQPRSVNTNTLRDDLKSFLPIQTTNGINYTWEVGSLNTNGTIGTELKTRIRSDFIQIQEGYIHVEKYKFNVFIYNLLDMKFIRQTGLLTEPYQVTEPCYVKILLAYSDDRILTTNDIPILSSALSVDVPKNKPLSVGFEDLNNTLANMLPIDSSTGSHLEWEIGGFYYTNGELTPSTTTRIRTTKKLIVDRCNINLTNNSYKYGIYKYSLADGSYIGWSDWQTGEYLIKEPCEIKILMAYKNDRVLTNDDVMELPKSLDMTTSRLPKVLEDDSESRYQFLDDLTGLYWLNQAEIFPNYTETQTGEVYAAIDTLVSDFPTYVTKTLSGSDEGGEIYKYTFIPHKVDSNLPNQKLKIFLTTGTHGNEKGPVFSAYNMFREMCYNWQSNNIIEFLRFNVEFIWIPIVNTGGFNANIRENLNGVDLNRDYPETADGDLSSHQLSTQVVGSEIKANTDASILLDFHNMYFRDGYMAYILTKDKEISEMSSQLLNTMGRNWQKKHPFFPQDYDHNFGYVDDNHSGRLSSYGREFGMYSAIAEVVRQIDWQTESNEYDELTVRTGTELLVNFLKGVIKVL